LARWLILGDLIETSVWQDDILDINQRKRLLANVLSLLTTKDKNDIAFMLAHQSQ